MTFLFGHRCACRRWYHKNLSSFHVPLFADLDLSWDFGVPYSVVGDFSWALQIDLRCDKNFWECLSGNNKQAKYMSSHICTQNRFNILHRPKNTKKIRPKFLNPFFAWILLLVRYHWKNTNIRKFYLLYKTGSQETWTKKFCFDPKCEKLLFKKKPPGKTQQNFWHPPTIIILYLGLLNFLITIKTVELLQTTISFEQNNLWINQR